MPDGIPALTPPAHVRTVTHEQLVAQVDQLVERRQEDYRTIERLQRTIDTNHLIYLDCFGQLARMVGGTLKSSEAT